jgi:hypothetical protein
LDVLANLEKLKDLDELEREYQNKKKDNEFCLELFKEYGVEHQLRRQVEFNADVTNVRHAVEAVNKLIRAFDAFLKEQDIELAAQHRIETKENVDIIGEINKTFERIKKTTEKVKQVLDEVRTDSLIMREKLVELERRREALKDDFASIERKLSEQLKQTGSVSIRTDDFVKLNAELQKANLALSEIAKSRIKKNSLKDEFIKELKRLSELWHIEFKQIELEIKRLNESQKALRIIPIYKGDKIAFLKMLQTVFKGSKLRETTLKGVIDQHADFISIYEGLESICRDLGESGDVFRRFFNENKASLIIWQVPNLFQIEYHGKELREHSLGQRASALILFILSQRDNDVIVIDQPEDDLDNHFIFDQIVTTLRKEKEKRQFLIATHNANIPVSGDAELIMVLEADDQHGYISENGIGSIDSPTIKVT